MTSQEELFLKGLQIRRDVLGEAHVDRSMSNASEFSRPMQELVTEYCWGAIWGRPGLEMKVRSLLNLAMLTALNRQHELAAHVRGAITNGCTIDEIRETLLQTAVYCGVPAALEAFRTAETVVNQSGLVANGSEAAESA
jgi:4-carboxymuconolactone decarboxylase